MAQPHSEGMVLEGAQPGGRCEISQKAPLLPASSLLPEFPLPHSITSPRSPIPLPGAVTCPMLSCSPEPSHTPALLS